MIGLEHLRKLPRWVLVILGVIVVLLLGLVDYLTGPEIAFSLFYLLPVFVITWLVGRTAGVWISIASAATWLVADLQSAVPNSSAIIHYWNGSVRLGGFLIVVYLLSAWKKNKEDKERALKDQMSVLADEMAERTRAEEAIRVSNEQLRQLAASIEAAREEERISLAREIHDVLGQALTGLKIDLSWLESRVPQAEIGLRKKIEEMKESDDLMLKAVRKISTQLRPAVLDHFGLVAALKWQTQEFQEYTGIRCSFTSNVEDVELDENRTTAVFRIYLEVLTNVARHASATELVVCLKQEDSTLTLKVADNGRGISEGEISNPASLGLLGMRERAHLLGGSVELHGSPRKGTRVTLRMPMNEMAGNHDQSAHR
jgi:signal transduction histidine kinase